MFPLLRVIAQLLISLILWVVIYLPFFLLFLLPTYLLRWGNHLFARIFRPDLICISDAMGSYLSLAPLRPSSNNNVSQIWILKGKLDIVQFRNHFYTSFLATLSLRRQYRNFYCYFEKWGLYVFKKALSHEEFKLEDYIKEYKGMPFKDEEDLEGFMGMWLNLNKENDGKNKQALWEMLIIYLAEKDESVLLFKIDHGLNDGLTFVNSIGILSGVMPPYSVERHEMRWMRKLRIILPGPFHILSSICSIMSMRRLSLPNYTGLKNGAENDWTMSFTTLDLEKIKKIRKITGVQITTILATIQNLALRRYCKENVDCKTARLPQYSNILIPTPIPGHPAMTGGANEEKMCNHFSSYLLKVPLGCEDSSLAKLDQTEREATKAEYKGLPLLMKYFVMPILWGIPTKLLLKLVEWDPVTQFGLANWCCQGLSPLVLSSRPHNLLGLEVKRLYMGSQAPISTPSMNIGMVPVSHSGRMDVAVNANFKIFRNQKVVDRFTKIYLNEELTKLEESVINESN